MKNCVKRLLLLLLVSPLSGLCQQKQDATLASLLAAAQQAQASNDSSTAVNDYMQAVKLRPEIPELWANLGLMQHETKDYEEAVHSFQQALRLKPSLYVPNLFLGIDYLRIGKAREAIPYLLKAEKMNATDSLPPLTLGQAYSSMGNFLPATYAYERALHLDPQKSSAWFGLGIVRLDQVENDARRLAREDQNSAYAEALYAESLVKQSRYKEAASSYKSALAITPQPPCIHADLGFLDLRQQDNDGAQAEFETERRIDPGCSLAMLGQARLRMDAGSGSDALRLLKNLWERDPGFIQSNARTLMDEIEPAHASAFQQYLFQQNGAGAVSPEFYQVLSTILSGEPQSIQKTLMPSDAAKHATRDGYKSGKYAQCAADFKRSIITKDADGLQKLATCAYFTGDYDLSANASEVLAAIAPHSIAALYWSIKANEHLAFSALDKFQQLEPNSARSHLLLGDIYRQRRRFDDAQREYEKALAITPHDPAALTGLASAYLGDAKYEKAIETAKLGLDQTSGDPELNLLMGEALVARHQMADAEPFLRKALGAKPQMLPHVHALLGQVYAEAGKTSQAIEQLKLGLQSDEDGSLHYQLARLYRQTGDAGAAAVAIDQMKSIQQQHRQRAVTALEDTHPSTLDDGP